MASIDDKIEALRNDTSVILDEMKPVIDSAAQYKWFNQWDIFRSPDGQYFADSMNVCSAFPIWLSLGVDMLCPPAPTSVRGVNLGEVPCDH